MRPSYVGLPMIRDKLIAHAAPTSEGVIDPNNLALIPHGGTSATVSGDGTSSNDSKGLRGGVLDQDASDPYDDMDDNLVVREVPTPFSGEMVDITSSSSEDIEVSPARDDDLNLTLRVPYSRLHGELSTFFNVFLLLRFVSCHGFTFSFLPFSLHFFFFLTEGSMRTMVGREPRPAFP
jgi:hypothetical protein